MSARRRALRVLAFLPVGMCLACAKGSSPRKGVSGRDVYLANGCAACHGVDADGRGMTGRSMDPPPTDFHDFAAYRFSHDRASIQQAIRAGVLQENSRMPAFGHIPPDEIEALTDYLISLQPTSKLGEIP